MSTILKIRALDATQVTTGIMTICSKDTYQ